MQMLYNSTAAFDIKFFFNPIERKYLSLEFSVYCILLIVGLFMGIIILGKKMVSLLIVLQGLSMESYLPCLEQGPQLQLIKIFW